MQIVTISNDRLWEIAVEANSTTVVDDWLRSNVKQGTWREKVALVLKPYRKFEFDNDIDATLFTLKWK